MKIAVLMKQVPNEDAAIKIDSDNKSIIEDNVTFITNEPDTYGLEEALLMQGLFYNPLDLTFLNSNFLKSSSVS